MAWVAVDKDGSEYIYENKPYRSGNIWNDCQGDYCFCMELPKGSIEKLIGHKLTWNDGPVELKEKK